jgi:Family of unknown function (DUF6353)
MKLPQGLTQRVGRQILTMQKNSPRVMFVAGIVGVVGSAVLACRATTKLPDVLDEFKKDVDSVTTREDLIPDHHYTRANRNVELIAVYVKGTFKIVRLYAPSLILGGVSIGALTGSHVTLTKRNTSLTAAYSALQMSYEAYRERVREELGEEKERDIHHGLVVEKAKIDGKIQEIRKLDPNKFSIYSKVFDEYNPNWQKNPELNRIFIQCQQNYANDLLHARGHVFLNEVYYQLGFDHTQAGAVVGWVLNQGGDNFIDFNMFEVTNAAFINGWERSIILDFNVDGVVFDKI